MKPDRHVCPTCGHDHSKQRVPVRRALAFMWPVLVFALPAAAGITAAALWAGNTMLAGLPMPATVAAQVLIVVVLVLVAGVVGAGLAARHLHRGGRRGV